MLKVIFGVAAGALAVVAWQSFAKPIGDLSAGEARAVAAGLAADHGGRAVTLQMPVHKKPDGNGWLVCGWASVGGPLEALGARPFWGLLSGSGIFRVATHAATNGEGAAIRDVCKARGMVL